MFYPVFALHSIKKAPFISLRNTPASSLDTSLFCAKSALAPMRNNTTS